jgi:hypothetical protein
MRLWDVYNQRGGISMFQTEMLFREALNDSELLIRYKTRIYSQFISPSILWANVIFAPPCITSGFTHQHFELLTGQSPRLVELLMRLWDVYNQRGGIS